LKNLKRVVYNSNFYKPTALLTHKLVEIVGDIIGNIQLRTSKQLIISGSSRLACQQWKLALKDVPHPDKGRLLFAAIRNRRWVEWAVFSACYLLQMGYQPTIIYSRQKIRQLYGEKQNSFWTSALSLPYFQWIDLDPLMTDDPAKTEFDVFAQERAHLVAAYDLEVEEYEPEQSPGEYEIAYQAAQSMLKRYAGAVYNILSQHSDQRLICPSGLIAESQSFYEVAMRLNHEAIYVESWSLRPGHNIWNLNHPALEYDIEGWMRSLGKWTDEIARDTQDYMAFREGQKVNRQGWLDNFHQVQLTTKDQSLPPELKAFLQRPGALVLLGTNVIGDSSTLRRQTLFRSQQAWLSEVIAFFKQHTELNLIIRTHPDELWANARVRLKDIARIYAGNASNIYIIGSEDKINTFSLTDLIDVCLAWVSNVGLDMALRGKPVIMAAKPKYTGLNIVYEPTDKETYFHMIEHFAANTAKIDEEAIRMGKMYHHIVFKLLSLEADDAKYQSANYRLGDQYRRDEQHKFYRILAGELDNYGQPKQV